MQSVMKEYYAMESEMKAAEEWFAGVLISKIL